MSTPSHKKFCVQQGCVPDYRLSFFNLLDRLVDGLTVCSGREYFESSVVISSRVGNWCTVVRNQFLFSRRFLWQHEVPCLTLNCQVLVCELNPRILSVWFVLFVRFFLMRPTLLWGHALGGRSTGKLRVSIGRRLMLMLCNGYIAYTRSDQKVISEVFRNLDSVALGNACLSSADCNLKLLDTYDDLVYVGRLTASKKVLVLVSAFLLLADSAKSPKRLHLVGEGDQRSSIEELISRHPKGGRVILHGHISDVRRLADIYSNCLFACSPGYAGLSVIQAMGHGVPVIVSRHEPHSPEIEACIEGVNCVYVEASTSDAWATAIMAQFKSWDKWSDSKVRQSICNHIKLNYTFESMSEKMAAFLIKYAPSN